MDIEKMLNVTINGKGDSDKHLMTIFSIAISLNAKNILEIGVREGSTTLPLLIAAEKLNSKVTSVDIKESNFLCDEKYKKYWKFFKQDSVGFLKKYSEENKEKFDLVYLDGWHSYEQVKNELFYLDKLVSPSSIILLHDLMYGNTQPFYHTDLTLKTGQWAEGGPYRAVCELNSQFWEFSTIPSNNGLTILRKKYTNLYY